MLHDTMLRNEKLSHLVIIVQRFFSAMSTGQKSLGMNRTSQASAQVLAFPQWVVLDCRWPKFGPARIPKQENFLDPEIPPFWDFFFKRNQPKSALKSPFPLWRCAGAKYFRPSPPPPVWEDLRTPLEPRKPPRAPRAHRHPASSEAVPGNQPPRRDSNF